MKTEKALKDFNKAIELNPAHISWYQLTIEAKTEFAKRPPELPTDEVLGEIEEEGLALLKEHLYERYEVSAFAQAGAQCQHNLNYWQFGDYIGIGAGAHGKLTFPNRVERRSKVKTPDKFMRYAGNVECLDEFRTVEAEELGFEFMMNALRLNMGFPKKR